jgi:pectinesterase
MTPAGFTRASVIEQLRPKYKDAALPSDELPETVVSHEDIVYAIRDGRELGLDLYQPAEPGIHPAILIVHGGGWERGDRTMERPLAKRLSALGYVAAPVTYRLGSEGRFPAALHDLKAAVRWLRENASTYSIDSGHIAAVGGSAGGQLVALLGATNGIARFEGVGGGSAPSDVEAVVDLDGLADFTAGELVDKEAREPGAPTRFLGGDFATRANVWSDASPITHIGPKSAPTLFINSTAPSPILPGRQAMCEKLESLDIDCELVVLPDTPHPFWLVQPWFEITVVEIDNFLRKRLRRP